MSLGAYLPVVSGKLDTIVRRVLPSVPVLEDDFYRYLWDGAVIETLVEGSAHGMELPSGLALFGEYLLVTDNATGKIFAFDRSGALVDELDLGVGPGALMGIDVAADDSIVGVDAVRNEVWRLAAEG